MMMTWYSDRDGHTIRIFILPKCQANSSAFKITRKENNSRISGYWNKLYAGLACSTCLTDIHALKHPIKPSQDGVHGACYFPVLKRWVGMKVVIESLLLYLIQASCVNGALEFLHAVVHSTWSSRGKKSPKMCSTPRGEYVCNSLNVVSPLKYFASLNVRLNTED